MRALVITIVLLVVAGAYLAVSLSVPPEGAAGTPHVDVKVEPPTGKAAAAMAKSKDEENLASDAQPAQPEPAPALPSSVTAMPQPTGAATTGGAVNLPGDGSGITITEQILDDNASGQQN